MKKQGGHQQLCQLALDYDLEYSLVFGLIDSWQRLGEKKEERLKDPFPFFFSDVEATET